MKNLKFIGFLTLLAFCSVSIQCTQDDPIPGPQGVAGIDGIDGKDGVDGTASCTSCHSNSFREPINSSFLFSSHYNETIMYNGMTLSKYTTQAQFGGNCAKCHSNEGYIDYISFGMTNSDGYLNATAISCTTCHGKHGTFDFTVDGDDFALRNFDPVTLDTDPSYTIDLGDKSNNCVTCHQPRSTPPIEDGNGMFAVTSIRWGPHYGPQSTFLEGIQGAEIAGSEVYPGIGSARHRTGSSCTNCHMGASEGGDNSGQHSFIPTSTACTTCHRNGIPSEVAGLAEDMGALVILLEGVGIIDQDQPVVGSYTIAQAEAAWNYLLLLKDSSEGIHNPNYSKALIKNSLEALNQ